MTHFIILSVGCGAFLLALGIIWTAGFITEKLFYRDMWCPPPRILVGITLMFVLPCLLFVFYCLGCLVLGRPTP